MFNFSEELTKNINSCNCSIKSGLVLRSKTKPYIYKEINSATCVVDLMGIDEIKRYKNIGSASNYFEASVENVIVKDKVKEVLGHPDYDIDLNSSPAGSITTIAYAIYLKTKLHLSESEHFYNVQSNSVTMIEQMASIISYYMNMPYLDVVKFPLNEIYHKYSILVKSFPSQVQDPFATEEDLM